MRAVLDAVNETAAMDADWKEREADADADADVDVDAEGEAEGGAEGETDAEGAAEATTEQGVAAVTSAIEAPETHEGTTALSPVDQHNDTTDTVAMDTGDTDTDADADADADAEADTDENSVDINSTDVMEVEETETRDPFYVGLGDLCRAHTLPAIEPTPLEVVAASNAAALAKAINGAAMNGAAGPPWLRDSLSLDVLPFLRHIIAYEDIRRGESRRFMHYLTDKTSIVEKHHDLIADGFDDPPGGNHARRARPLARAWSHGGAGSGRVPCACSVCVDSSR